MTTNSSQANHSGGPRPEPVVPELDASRFEMLNPVGSGGMGTVYRAVQRSVGRHVAVKVLSSEHAANATGLARFVREANIIARLTHPNIVQLIDFGRDRDGRMLLVMELLEGESLRALLRREGRLAPERAVYVAVQTLNALRVAHAAGVVHRDLKPENVFMHRAGDDDHVKVLDFGVAKLTQNDIVDANTTQGSLVGTLRYMAPEQIAGETPDHRIDVYAVGMLLYEMLANAMPYDTRDRYVLLRQIIAEEPAHLLTRVNDVSPALAEVVMRAIQKSPRDRFQSADEFRRALTPFLNGDHARLQALSDASNRTFPTGNVPVPGGEIRSGIVRSGHVQMAASVMQGMAQVPPTGLEQTVHARSQASMPGYPSQAAMMGHPSQVGPMGHPSQVGPMGHPSQVGPWPSSPGYVVAPPMAIAPQPAPRSNGPVIVAVAVMLIAGLGGAAWFLTQRTAAPPPAPRVIVADPPSQPATATTAQPAQPTAPAPAPRMVTVTTTPPGARISSTDGTVLCAATPCAIPVPAGRPLAVRVQRESVSLDAMIDPSSPSASIDLRALVAPAQTGNDAPRRPRPRPTNTGHGENNNGGSELPMFLPH